MKENLHVLLDSEKKRLAPVSIKLKEVDDLMARINTLLKKSKLKAECVAGGSYAKGVILKNDFDVDLFVRFGYDYRDKDISKLLGNAIKSLKPVLVHGSRDYFWLKREGILFEIIPVIKINDYKKAVNVTDMSPLHVVYANKHFGKNSALRDEVRLAKQFCKAAKVYGAESFIRGFSGHVLDLMIIHYGSFEKFLMQASVWGERVVIDLEGHWSDPLQQLNSSKIVSPLVVVDPLQPDRNAAAAISDEKFAALKKAAREFLHNPSPDFFKVKKIDIAELRKIAGKNSLVVAKAVPFEGKDDVVYTKALRVHEFFMSELRRHGFMVLSSGWEHGIPCISYFVVSGEKLSDFVLRRGPPSSDAANCKAFKAKHKRVSVTNGVLYAKEKREFTNPQLLLKSIAKNKFCKDKVKSISFS